MESLLLTVTLSSLVAILQTHDVLPSIKEEDKLSGVWFIKATVSQREVEAKSLVAFPIKFTCPEEGTLELRYTIISKGECINLGIRMQRTEEPGQYSAFLGRNLFYIYELPVKDHYIIYSTSHPSQKISQLGHLIGKCPEENLEALEVFKEFIQHKGFLQENIIVPEQRERCIPIHDSAHQDHNC
ncbi:odorant-binding protein 2b [Mastomys coucha]|uniref:odorant-binding protein 2b n=1 Tax=Mastomys coucha TaxID=35658 RepID=UPI0012626D56|nr:odorant-binding protein 2b [Mastomys coucha]